MKLHFLHLIFTCLVMLGCAGTKSQQHIEDYIIAELALEQFISFPKFRLLEKPNNKYINNYLDGFQEDSIDLANIKLAYNQHRVKEWSRNKFWNKDIKRKITIVQDFSKIPKVPITQVHKADTYISMSNPIYSTDGNYAVINVNVFDNMEMIQADGYILIFKKVKGKWQYHSRFTPYVT